MMHEAVDYNALSWVRQEIDVTLRQACDVLVEYSGDTERVELLHTCAGLLHQLRGPLQIAELSGADSLAAEMESVVSGLQCDGSEQHAKALEILLSTIRILPVYISRLKSSADDSRERVLPQLELLRSVRGDRDSVSTAADRRARVPLPEGVFLGRDPGSAAEITARARSARVRFQSALLAWYRGGPGNEGVGALADVLGELQAHAGTETEAGLWWVCAGAADALGAGLLQDSREMKQLFGQVDRQIKRLVESGDVDFGDAQSSVLFDSVLQILSGIEAAEGRVAAILDTYSNGLPEPGRDCDSSPDKAAAADAPPQPADVMDLSGLGSEGPAGTAAGSGTGLRFMDILRAISLVKDSVEEYLNHPAADSPLPSVPVILDGVCNDLQSTGLGRVAAVIAAVQAFIDREMLASPDIPEEEHLLHLADAICGVEFYLECLRDGRIAGNRMIELAEAGVAALGYPVHMQTAPVSDQARAATEEEPAAILQETADRESPASLSISALQVVDQDADKEILEVFFEESEAELRTLRGLVGGLGKIPVAVETLEEISRVFHTLKGNGRMLGANALGEFAYVMEVLVAGALHDSVPADSGFAGLLDQACEALSQLLAQVKDATAVPGMDIDALASVAAGMSHAVADGKPVPAVTTGAETEIPVAAGKDNVSCGPECDLPVLAPDADPEIVEILVEEAGEEITGLEAAVPAWLAAPENTDLLADIRRSMHTLKGSGRMAGAMYMGEYAWAMEDLLNRVISGTVRQDDALYSLVQQLPEVLQQLVTQLSEGTEPTANITALMDKAAELGKAATDTSTAAVADVDDMNADRIPVDAVPAVTDQEDHTQPLAAEQDNFLQQIYARECREIIGTIRDYLDEDPAGGKVTEPLYRGLHTLAGISESAEIGCIGRLASELDRYFSNLYHLQCRLPYPALEVLRDSSDAIVYLLEKLPDVSAEAGLVDDLCCRLESLHQPDAQAADTEAAGSDASQTGRPQEMPESEAPGFAASDSDKADIRENGFSGVDQELYEVFLEEAAEIMDASERVLHAWAADPDNRDSLVEYQRHLHTLKGSARMMNITAIGDLSHALETLLTRIAENTLAPSAGLFSTIFVAQDQLGEMLELVKQQQMPAGCDDLEARLEQLLHIRSGETEPAVESREITEAEQAADEGSPDSGSRVATAEITGGTAAMSRPEPGTEQPAASGTDESSAAPVAADEVIPPAPGNAELQVLTPDRHAESGMQPGLLENREYPIPLRPEGQLLPVRKRQSRQRRGEPVKVQSELLDDLVNYAGEINIYRSRMETQVGDYRFNLGELEQTINRLRGQLRKLEMETEAQILYRHAQETDQHNQEFDPLELDRYSALQESSRSLMESISDLYSLLSLMENTTRESETVLLQQSRVSTDLQEGLMHTRMRPFSGLETRLKRIVRQSARQLDKKVELELQGADGEMDRTVIERITAPLEHMLRNAVAHGIELPSDRLGKGKEQTGIITIAFSREGPDIVLRISDDGAGMNVGAIREKAVEKGMLDPGADISDSDVTQFVLQTGFSTASEVTQLSGRGVGLDVVNSEVKQLGGSLHIDSSQGTGTVFTIRLPYTLAINQALLVNAGTDTYCVPLGNVEGVVRARPEELLAAYATDDPLFEYAGNQYQLKHLATLLGTDELDASQMSARVPLLLMRIADKRIALHVESLLGSREIVIKPVGAQLNSIDGISGATILGDGSVAMILDVFALSRGNTRSHPALMRVVSRDEKRLVVMVVDDSITVRKVTTRLLERNGYKVLTAKDGVDATGQLQACTPDIMLLDIEMPRMDGFELATHMRNDERLRHVPVVMITSRAGDKHRERAQQLGVNHYLGKPYQETDLLDTIDRIIRVAPENSPIADAEV